MSSLPSWAIEALSDRIDGNAIDWYPQAGPQSMAFYSRADELLYGGSAGGGKSALLVGLARLHHTSSVIFRRTYPQLEDSIIKQTIKFYGNRKNYNASKHTWNFDDGRTVALRSMQYDENKYDHQGAEYDLICFDELTQFLESQYIYLISRLRSANPNQRCRVVNTTNPGGEGNDWVMKRWAAWLDKNHPNPAKPGELRWYVYSGKRDCAVEMPGWYRIENDQPVFHADASEKLADPDIFLARSRTFIPASLIDNEYLGAEYLATLQSLPEPLRSQLLNGDWQAGMVDDAHQVIPSAWIEAAIKRWNPDGGVGNCSSIGVDVAYGGDDQTVLCKRYGNWIAPLEAHPGHETQDGYTVALLMQSAMYDGGCAFIDAASWGSAAYENALSLGLPVVGVNFANKSDCVDATGLLRFANMRAELYWRARESFDPKHGINLAIPPDNELVADLKQIRWSMQSNGIRIESKDEIRKRIGRSTDKGDAFVLSLLEEVTQGLVRTDGPI